jgi:hypothetical protein
MRAWWINRDLLADLGLRDKIENQMRHRSTSTSSDHGIAVNGICPSLVRGGSAVPLRDIDRQLLDRCLG